ncbi:GNAT family N-acetyltransferase [Streptomyces sp. NPDC057939]|uniref:GNAT family N-acetyltransferase n=1 Tax=Streptomyces sp. NPDC057939 TaxID=3346284 RepID=UPI0036E13A9D
MPEPAPVIDDRPPVDRCAAVLADAFAREPATSWICGTSDSVRAHWFAATLRTQSTLPGARRHILVTPDGRPVAAAVLTPPGATPGVGARAGWATRTLLRGGPDALRRTLRYLEAAETEVPAEAWTLEFIGVIPAAAGRGWGRLLLDHVLAGTPGTAGIFLTTADPANVGLYRHFGFTVLRHLPVGPLRVTSMHRPAATGPT